MRLRVFCVGQYFTIANKILCRGDIGVGGALAKTAKQEVRFDPSLLCLPHCVMVYVHCVCSLYELGHS